MIYPIVLDSSFFNRDAVTVARDLLGKYLMRDVDGVLHALMINEVEAYDGPHDLASHSRFGLTQRTRVMFGPAGYWYTYLIYGMYWMLNIVTGPEQYPSGVLIRGAGALIGPGRLTRFLTIDRTLNGLIAQQPSGLWIEDRGLRIESEQIIATPRIGIDYAGPYWSQVPYRFLYKG